MRNEGPEPTADGPEPEDGSAYTSAAARRPRRRKQIIAGAAGVFAVLGVAGAVVAVQANNQPDPAPPANVGALPPLDDAVPVPSAQPGATVRTGSAPATASPSPGAPRSTGAARAVETPPDPPERSRTAERKDEDAGAAALPQPTKTLRALPDSRSTVKGSEVTVDETRSADKRRRLRVASARTDLTGYQELAWVTDDTTKVGDVECTNKIRLSPDVPATERPTLLICWRLSGTKSVYTVAVDMDGRPAPEESVAALSKRWQELG
ncbi:MULTISPECIES: hypothetical protein [Catenuloplanes]|uniref:Uncharacterized protein n=1 Tax=Catenuloplanes niger TaxID=587534 RepID=A0AAE3ZS30_9ACTN|nr:hypothetical protein [Catenuloplanes niger]MDR7323927.1 hypothetical protein [Catenuloplanes niger]